MIILLFSIMVQYIIKVPWYFQLKRRTSDMFLDHVSVMCLSVE